MSIPDELELLFESFDRNGRVNRALLATLSTEDLDYGDGVGGYNVGQHLADLVDFRPSWLGRVSPQHAARIPSVIDENSPTWLKIDSIEQLEAAFEAGDSAMREAVLEAVLDERAFESVYQAHPAHLMQHCIVHDSHHRGQILALLRQAGRPADERHALEEATWPIWRE